MTIIASNKVTAKKRTHTTATRDVPVPSRSKVSAFTGQHLSLQTTPRLRLPSNAPANTRRKVGMPRLKCLEQEPLE